MKRLVMGAVAFSLSGIMLTQSMPTNLTAVLVEELGDMLTKENVIEHEIYSGNLVDSDNIGKGYIVQENTEKRTLTSKEFWMSDDTIMVQQFIEPIHYLENGEYKEIEGTVSKEEVYEEESLELEGVIEEKSEVEVVNIGEDGAIITDTKEAYIGKKGGTEKSDVFLNFQLPTVEPYYQLLGATICFEYETNGMSLLNGKDLVCDVYVAESETDLQSITSSNKLEKVEELNGIEKKSQRKSKVMTYESDIINPRNLQSDTLTVGIATADEMSDEGYIVLNTATSSASVQYWYKVAIGIEDEYSMEALEINGAVSYVNAGTGKLTSVIDLALVNTLSDMPFETSLIYNDYYNDVLSKIGKSSIAGNNFKLNFQQFMIGHNNVYEMIDADGSISTFYPYGSSRGFYYSKEKKLYYDSAIGVAKDLQGNKMQFTNGRLTQICNENNPTEYINIVYASDTSDQIERVEYYADSVLKYTMSFGYLNGRISTVTTNVDDMMQLKKALMYDEEGNLVSIKNQTGNTIGVQTLSLGYFSQTLESDPVGLLNDIYDNQKNGLKFNRNHDRTIYSARNIKSQGTGADWRCYSSIEFGYYGIYTKVYYYENNIITGMRYVAFNNAQEVISEWQEDANGRVTVQASTNWKNISTSGTNNYVKETCTYSHSENSANTRWVRESGGTLTYTKGAASLEVGNHENYSFAIIFKVVTSDVDSELQAGLNLSVKIADEDAENIILDFGGSTYIVIPCTYYSSDFNIVITNNGSKEVGIQYFDYTLVNLVREAFTYSAEIRAHKVSSTTTSLRTGHYSYITYDDKQRVSNEQTSEIATDSVTETTTYTYYDNVTDHYLAKGKIKAIDTVKENSTDIEKTEYTYSGTWTNYAETVLQTKGEEKTLSRNYIRRTSNSWIVTQTDTNNVQTIGYYKPLSGDMRLEKVEYGNTKEEYTYNNLGQLTNISVKDKSTSVVQFEQTDNYDTNGVYLGSSYGGMQYTYGYDNTGFVTSITSNESETPKLTYTYNPHTEPMPGAFAVNSNRLNSKTYANGDKENYSYTSSKTTVTHKNDFGTTKGIYEYYYNNKGAMTSQTYKINGYTKLTYDYGDLSNLKQQTLTISGLEFAFEYMNEYDTLNNRIKKSQIYSLIGCQTTDYKNKTYSYNADGYVSGINYGNFNAEYGYDDFGHLQSKIGRNYSFNIQNEEYIYKTYGNGYTTNLLTRIDDKTNKNSDRMATYDENGYVTSVSYNGNTYQYEYDGAGRLTSETRNGDVTSYSYYTNNNINIPGFSYDENGQLTSVNGAAIVYDEMGNPVIYKGNNFVWEQGRKLVGGSMRGDVFTYNYDGNGMRYEKTVNGTKTQYYWNGDQLLMESKSGKRTWYIYGVTGIEGMIVEGGYNGGTYYYFDKNTLGDIIAIRDSSGNIAATYEYDAWGNGKVMDVYGGVNTNPTFIGNINPFRYRGYYYDDETGFYYLQTRYYDPTICRFINADNYELVSQLASSKELNMYAYCRNNPIMHTDETGENAV